MEKMSRPFSIYLDLLRFVAACLVVVYHSNSRLIVENVLPLSSYGHDAVIVFFVLSGYVIAYATDTKDQTARDYWASRLSRVLSLAVPAVLMAPILDIVGESLAPQLYVGNTTHDHAALRIVTSLLFLNEIWSVSIMSFSNIAYWSLNYEVWYYVLFALYAFGSKQGRWLWIGIVTLLLGPKIALLAPIWLLGVVLYRWEWPQHMSEGLAWLCALGSLVLFAAFEHFNLTDLLAEPVRQALGERWYRELTFSRWFPGDYLLGVIVFLNFAGMRRLAPRFAPLLSVIERPVRAAAAYTFSIYILHQPLIYFFAAVVDMPPTGYAKYGLVMACVSATVVLVGYQTERRRHGLRKILDSVMRRSSA